MEFEFGNNDHYVEYDANEIDEEDSVDDSSPLGTSGFEDGLERSECFADVDGTQQCVLAGESDCLETVVDVCCAAEGYVTICEKE